jgi:hypothetical protein
MKTNVVAIVACACAIAAAPGCQSKHQPPVIESATGTSGSAAVDDPADEHAASTRSSDERATSAGIGDVTPATPAAPAATTAPSAPTVAPPAPVADDPPADLANAPYGSAIGTANNAQGWSNANGPINQPSQAPQGAQQNTQPMQPGVFMGPNANAPGYGANFGYPGSAAAPTTTTPTTPTTTPTSPANPASPANARNPGNLGNPWNATNPANPANPASPANIANPANPANPANAANAAANPAAPAMPARP